MSLSALLLTLFADDSMPSGYTAAILSGKKVRWIIAGNSLSVGWYMFTSPWTTFLTLEPMASNGSTVANHGIPAIRISEMMYYSSANTYKNEIDPDFFNVLVVWEGVNELSATGDVASTLNWTRSFCAAERPKGYDLIFVATITPVRIPAGSPTAGGDTNATYQPKVFAYNQALRDDTSGVYYDGLIDLGADYRFWDALFNGATPALYSDDIHHNAAGYPLDGDNVKEFADAFDVNAANPATPTGGIVDDTAKTFTFTPVAGIPATEHEARIKSSGWVTCTSNVVTVGAEDVPPGFVQVRVKAAPGRNRSNVLANQTAFTA